MAKPKLTIALSHYDRHVPFFDGTVQPEGVDLNVLIVGQSDVQRDGEERHERMLQKGEFDVAELSLSSYLMAKSRGMPFTAIRFFRGVCSAIHKCGSTLMRELPRRRI